MAARKGRGPGKQFKKGSPSPNPAGRPKEHPEIRAALADSLHDGLQLVRDCIADKKASWKDKLSAVRILYDFGLAKPAPEIGAANAERLAALVEALKG